MLYIPKCCSCYLEEKSIQFAVTIATAVLPFSIYNVISYFDIPIPTQPIWYDMIWCDIKDNNMLKVWLTKRQIQI